LRAAREARSRQRAIVISGSSRKRGAVGTFFSAVRGMLENQRRIEVPSCVCRRAASSM
jgi:hypothetical protein